MVYTNYSDDKSDLTIKISIFIKTKLQRPQLIRFGPVVSTGVLGIQIDEGLVSSLDHGLLSRSGSNVSVIIRIKDLQNLT